MCLGTYFLPLVGSACAEGPLGHFEHSLRGGDSPAPDRKVLHKGCCGSLHGNGVRKEKPDPLPTVKKKCSLDSSCSDDSAWDGYFLSSGTPAATFHIKRLAMRSQSSDCAVERRHRSVDTEKITVASTLPRRASSAVVSQRLYSTPTRAATAKFRTGGPIEPRPTTPAATNATAAATTTAVDAIVGQQQEELPQQQTPQLKKASGLRHVI